MFVCMYVCMYIYIYVCNASGIQLCPTVPKWLPLTNCFTVPILCSRTLQGIAQAPLYSIPTPKVKYGVHDHSTAFHLYAKEQPLLTYISHHSDSYASCVQTEAVLPHTGERQCNAWNFNLFIQPLLYLILLQWTFKLFNSSLSVRILCSCE